MRFISTRGPAPAVGFFDALLARPGAGRRPLCARGLAAASPREEIAGFAGRPYAEVAADVLGRFAGARSRRPTVRAMCRRGLRHLRPSGGDAAQPARRRAASCWSCSTARPWPSRTWPCSSWPGSTTTRWRRGGAALTIVCATSGDTGGAAVEAFRGARQRPHRRPLPRGPHQRGPAPVHDHGAAGQRPRVARRRRFRRLPGHAQGLFAGRAFCRRGRTGGGELDQLRARRRPVRLLLRRRGGAGSAGPAGRLRRPHRQFR